MKEKCFTTFINQGLFTDSSQSLSKAEPLYLNLKDWWTIHSTYFCSKKANNQIMKLNRNMSGLRCLTSAVTRLLRLLRSHTHTHTHTQNYEIQHQSTFYSLFLSHRALRARVSTVIASASLFHSSIRRDQWDHDLWLTRSPLLPFPVHQSFFLDIFTSFQIFCMLTFSLH